jgi:hypothetical protein
VHWSSTDLFAELPDDTSVPADSGGSATFTLTLTTAGDQTIRANDVNQPTLLSDADVQVGQSPAPRLDLASLLDGSAIRKHEAGYT